MDNTAQLFAMPSMLSGLARTLDIGGTLDSYNESPTPSVADARAIASDFAVVGEDLRESVNAWAAEHLNHR